MRYLVLIFSFLIFGCNSKPEMKSIYPFSEANKIEILSFPEVVGGNSLLIKNGKVNIADSTIKERINLTEKTKGELFNFLFINDCPIFSDNAKCYNPRHLIVFYDGKGKAFNYLEVCLECGRAKGGFDHNDFCDNRADELKLIFKEAGINYFGEDEY